MLTATNDRGAGPAAAAVRSGLKTSKEVRGGEAPSRARRKQLARVLRVEWLGQTAASLCWIASVMAYGISSTGDWLQLAAASAWLLANLAAVVASESD